MAPPRGHQTWRTNPQNQRRPDDQVSPDYARRRLRDGGTAWSGYRHQRAKAYVMARDGSCRWCGVTRGLELDHVVERQLQPDHSYDNLQALCHDCHLAKSEAFRAATIQLIHAYREQFEGMLAAQQRAAKSALLALPPIPAEVEQAQTSLF